MPAMPNTAVACTLLPKSWMVVRSLFRRVPPLPQTTAPTVWRRKFMCWNTRFTRWRHSGLLKGDCNLLAIALSLMVLRCLRVAAVFLLPPDVGVAFHAAYYPVPVAAGLWLPGQRPVPAAFQRQLYGGLEAT